MMTHTILQTWKQKDLATAPRLFQICQPTWARYHADWHYALFDDDDIDAYVEQHYPEFARTLWQRYPRGIQRADLIRYLFLFREGGLYADLDFECLKNVEPLLAHARGDVMLGRLSAPNHPEGIPNAWMAARRPRQLFWLLVLDEVRRAVDAKDTIERTGPVALGRAVRAYRSRRWTADEIVVTAMLKIDTASVEDGGLDVVDGSAIYPICWIRQQQRRRLFLWLRRFVSHDRIKRWFPTSYAITYWTHSW
jgi:mannosyltransferase OCH1-like enzyme